MVEAILGVDHGFWGSVADGATFRSTGRRRTQPGREVIRRNRADLDESEHVAGEHVRAWQAGRPTPCAAALDAMAARWDALGDGEGLVTTWPDLADRGTVGPVRAQDLQRRR